MFIHYNLKSLFLTFITCFLFYSTLYAQQTKTITGTVSHFNSPISDVNIKIEGTNIGVESDSAGFYKIKAKTGDVLNYSHIKFKSLSIVVEDVTTTLNIEMQQMINELDEAVVKANKKENPFLRDIEKRNEKFKTAVGTFNPAAIGFPVAYIDGDRISNVYPTISDALVGKFPGATRDATGKLMVRGRASLSNPNYPIWDVDGQIFQEEPSFLDLNNIYSVHILNRLGTTTLYGTLGAGGVVVIRTKFAANRDFKEASAKYFADNINQEIYNNDALGYDTNSIYRNAYTETIKGFNNEEKAFEYYNDLLLSIKDYWNHIDIANIFFNFYGSKIKAENILVSLKEKHSDNPEILKVLAYYLQDLKYHREAIAVYKQIFNLRPEYAQSYRDLANAYVENEQFKQAWRIYLSYFMQGHSATDNDIGSLLYNEMEYLYYNRKNQTDIAQNFVPRHGDIYDFRNDVRLVLEWNTGEAEFEIEFVNPNKQVYIFDHTLAGSQKLITEEKLRGYSSKEFYIDDIDGGEWLVNMVYKGNKKPEPTYFKLTKYFNWGSPNQKRETNIYQFKEETQKIQLLALNENKVASLTEK